MLWKRCCRLRQCTRLMSEPQATQNQAHLLADDARRLAARIARLYRVRKAISLAFRARSRIRLRLRRVSTRSARSSLAQVTGVIFHGGRPEQSHGNWRRTRTLLNAGPKMKLHHLTCLAIPAVMTVRSLCSYANAYYMKWVSNRVLTDIRDELFNKMLRHSMDFFNKMQSGFLMSRITNDTRGMQTALSTVSSDVFKQPVTIISGIAVLLYMDWKFTIVTLVLFPSCLIPISLFGKRARKAMKHRMEDMGQMVVTMQETFAGIRVVKSFAREEASGKIVSSQQQAAIPERDAHRSGRWKRSARWLKRSPPSASVWRCFTSISPT